MTFEEFIGKHDDKIWGYPDGQYVGECLSVVKLYIEEVFGINPPPSGTNSAYGYWSNFPDPLGEKFEKISGVLPEVGWIAIWNTSVGGGSGHIDIVAGNVSENGFDGFDANWGGKQSHYERHNYSNIVGYLKPKGEEVYCTYELFGNKPDGKVYERLNNYSLVWLPNPDFAASNYGPNWADRVQWVDDVWKIGWIAEDPRPLKTQINDLTAQEATMVTVDECSKDKVTAFDNGVKSVICPISDDNRSGIDLIIAGIRKWLKIT